jgi:hypothetical protein
VTLPRKGPAWIALATGLCFAARLQAADDPVAPAAAVLPTIGELPAEVHRTLTVELRRNLARRGFGLVAQNRVRKLAAGLPSGRIPEALDLARIGGALGAELVVAARVERADVGGLAISGNAVWSGTGILGPARIHLLPGGDVPSPDEMKRAAEGLLRALFSGAGDTVPQAATVAAPPGDDAPRQPTDIERHDEGEWYDADHEGFFGDLSFLLSWCASDVLCSETGTGYGGRLRLGWRFASYVAVSATAVFAGHKLPSTTDLAALARTERVLLWYGFHGGVRLHPINRSWFDPFLGIDLGWTRLFYSEKVESDAGDCTTTYMGVDLCEYTAVRNGLAMDGFTLTPQLGINFFITRNVALGIVAEFLLPFWSKACNEISTTALNEGTNKDNSCVDIEDADRDFLALENGTLDEEKELPWHFDLELHFSFVF